MRPCTVTLLVLGTVCVTPTYGQSNAARTPARNSTGWVTPRTADGRPDLQGLWNFATATPLERPPEFGGREFLTDLEIASVERQAAAQFHVDGPKETLLNTPPFWLESGTRVVGTRRSSLIVEPRDGRLPAMTPAGLQRAAAHVAARAALIGPESLTPWERCITRGLPSNMLPGPYNDNIQILQTRGYIALSSEMIHEMRIVSVDGRVSPPPTLRAWMGYSNGRWEGETLVIDTTHFSDDADFIGRGQRFMGGGRDLHLIERLTRVDANTIDYRLTIDDPANWTQPWTMAIPLVKTEGPMYEYACHEANYNLANILSTARSRKSGGPAGNR
jgi:hypothetical protein